jgi:cyclopropane fatty-acyl-phospholipid synthase-like methyltransferase
MNITWTEPEQFIASAKEKIYDTEIVLDIGCGIRPQNYIKPRVHICCDPHKEYLDYLQKHCASFADPSIFQDFKINPFCTVEKESSSSFVFINADWESVIEMFPEKSVDTVFLMDVIEHLNKEKGKKLLEKTERIARNQFIVFTPLGFISQEHDDEDAWGMHGGELQKHRSGWLPEEFGDGYEFIVCRNFHSYDAKGNKFDEPRGAFYAILNIAPFMDKQKDINHNSDEFAEAFSKLGEYILANENDADKALKYLNYSLEYKPDYPDAINNLGAVAWLKGDKVKALEYFRKAYQLETGNRVYVANLADVLVANNLNNEAESIVDKYLDYFSHDEEMLERYKIISGKNWKKREASKTSNLEYWQKMQEENYFENHMYYGDGTSNLPLFGDDLEVIKSFIELRTDMNVAVIGCGYGRESVLLGPLVKQIYGIDVNKKILDKAVKYVNNHGVYNFIPILANTWREDIKDSLDFVFELTVFQHLTKDLTKDYISGLAEKLKPEGKMLLQFMDCEYGSDDAEMKKYEPCVNWSMEQIEDTARDFNLQILKVEHRHWPADKAYWHWVLLGKSI